MLVATCQQQESHPYYHYSLDRLIATEQPLMLRVSKKCHFSFALSGYTHDCIFRKFSEAEVLATPVLFSQCCRQCPWSSVHVPLDCWCNTPGHRSIRLNTKRRPPSKHQVVQRCRSAAWQTGVLHRQAQVRPQKHARSSMRRGSAEWASASARNRAPSWTTVDKQCPQQIRKRGEEVHAMSCDEAGVSHGVVR